jgi:hypothetical protein
MTAIKYHLNKHMMPAPCEATTRPCPLGGYHFSTPEEAEFHALDMSMKSQHGLDLRDGGGYVCRCGWLPKNSNMDGMFDVQDHAREAHAAEVEYAREAMERAQKGAPAKTLAELRTQAEGPMALDEQAPEGFFTATTKVLGLLTVYVLAGSPDNEDSQIAGRIEYGEMGNAVYRGNRYKGGNLVGFNRSNEDALKRIAHVDQDFSKPYAR